MKTKAIIVALGLICVCVPRTHAQGSTVITYQGRLNANGSPVTGIYDLRFTIYDSSGGAGVVGGPLSHSATSITHRLFSTPPGFLAGGVLRADRRVLIAVRPGGRGRRFIKLQPRP